MEKFNKQSKTKQCTIPSIRRSAVLIVEPTWNVFNKIPIWVNEITNDLFPVKFEYKQRGYEGLVFSERLNRIEFD